MSAESINETKPVVVRRVYRFPVDKVYQAWTDPAKLRQWFAPNIRWKPPLLDFDTQAGGRRNLTMRHSDGDEMRVSGKYVEVISNQKLSFTWQWLDHETMPGESLVSVDFREVPDGTEITITHSRLIATADQEGITGGWTGLLEMLETYFGGTTLSE